MYLSNLEIVFVQIAKCFYQICKLYLSKQLNVFVFSGVRQTTGASGASNVDNAGTWEFADVTESTENANQQRNVLTQEWLQAMPGWAKWGSKFIQISSLSTTL